MQTTDHLCPGILHAVPAKDGLLVRIRTPGGLISGVQFKAVARAAERFSDHTIDITARSNIQLRGIRQENLTSLIETLASENLIPSTQHDRVRNITTSPLAGLDPEEVFDTRTLVQRLDQALIKDSVLANLPPKFSFHIDGGGHRFDSESADIGLRAIVDSGAIQFCLTLGDYPIGFSANANYAVESMIEAAHLCLDISKTYKIPSRAKIILSVPDAFEDLMSRLSSLLPQYPHPLPPLSLSRPKIGVLPGTQSDKVHIIPSIPLGRLTASQGDCIAEIIIRYKGDLRLAPWRGIVLGEMPVDAIDTVIAELRAVGLCSDTSDGYVGIAACAGLSGCASALADVRQDASLLAQRLAGTKANLGRSINLSGCEKRCAMRNNAAVELVAEPSGYNIKINEVTLRSECPPEAAIELVVSSLRSEALLESES